MDTAVENEKDASDRRVFERIPIDYPLRFKNSTQDREGRGFCWDISASGLGCYSKDPLTVNDLVDLWIELPEKYNPLHLNGKVVWVKEAEPRVWRSGIEFSEVRLMDLSPILRAKDR